MHGKKAAKECETTAKETFSSGGAIKGLPEIRINKSDFVKGLSILDLLATNQIVTSKSEARRAINSNGIKINDKLVTDDKLIINLDNFQKKIFIKISFGKKKHYIIKIN